MSIASSEAQLLQPRHADEHHYQAQRIEGNVRVSSSRSPGMSKFFRASNVVLLLLCAMYFITYLDRVNVSTAAAGFSKEFDLSKTQIGLVFSAFAYPYLVFQIIGG